MIFKPFFGSQNQQSRQQEAPRSASPQRPSSLHLRTIERHNLWVEPSWHPMPKRPPLAPSDVEPDALKVEMRS